MVAESFAKRLNKALDFAEVPPGRERRLAVSRMFAVSREAVRKWLSGESFPDTKRIPEIAHKLGVRAEWLLTGAGPMQATAEFPTTKTALKPQSAADLRHIWELAAGGLLTRDDISLLKKMADRLARTTGA